MDKKPFPSETQERFIVRLPDGMRDRIAETAKTNGRSMNSEIVSRLWESFEGSPELERLREMLETEAKTADALRHELYLKTAELELHQRASGLPEPFRSDIEHTANEWGVPFDEALERVISAGLNPNAPEVVIIRIDSTVKADQMAQLFDIGRTKMNKDASIIFEKTSLLQTQEPAAPASPT